MLLYAKKKKDAEHLLFIKLDKPNFGLFWPENPAIKVFFKHFGSITF